MSTSGVVNTAVLFFIFMQEVAGGCIDPKGTVNIIQEAKEANNSILPFCHLSARLPQNGADRNSTNGLEPIRKPLWLAFMPICLKYTPISGNKDPKAE